MLFFESKSRGRLKPPPPYWRCATPVQVCFMFYAGMSFHTGMKKIYDTRAFHVGIRLMPARNTIRFSQSYYYRSCLFFLKDCQGRLVVEVASCQNHHKNHCQSLVH